MLHGQKSDLVNGVREGLESEFARVKALWMYDCCLKWSELEDMTSKRRRVPRMDRVCCVGMIGRIQEENRKEYA